LRVMVATESTTVSRTGAASLVVTGAVMGAVCRTPTLPTCALWCRSRVS
jgi:hypothetical protein